MPKRQIYKRNRRKSPLETVICVTLALAMLKAACTLTDKIYR